MSQVSWTRSFGLSLLAATGIASPGSAAAQGNAAPAEQPENNLPGSRETTVRDDPYLRLPTDMVRDDPLMRRLVRTSRSAERRDKAVAVLDRQRPDYDPVGIHVGSFRFFPAVTTSANLTNNVFRQSDEKADAFLRGRAEGVLKSDWNRHALTLNGFFQKDLHAEYTTENNFSYAARANGRLDIFDGDVVTARAAREHIVQDRGNTGDILTTRRPVRYDESEVDAGIRLGGKARFVGRINLGYRNRDYADSVTPDRLPFDQDFRNYEDYIASGQIGYKIGAEKEVFVSASHTWRRYDFDLPERRDTNITEVLVGIEGDITPVIRGRLGVGYLEADFISNAIKDQKGIALDASVDFMVTELTTITAVARRELRNVAGVNSSSATGTTVRIGIDHEFLRNVIVSPSLAYDVADYVGSGRTAKLVIGDVTGRWLVSKRLRATGSLTYRRRDASGFNIQRDYSSFDFSLGLTLLL